MLGFWSAAHTSGRHGRRLKRSRMYRCGPPHVSLGRFLHVPAGGMSPGFPDTPHRALSSIRSRVLSVLQGFSRPGTAWPRRPAALPRSLDLFPATTVFPVSLFMHFVTFWPFEKSPNHK